MHLAHADPVVLRDGRTGMHAHGSVGHRHYVLDELTVLDLPVVAHAAHPGTDHH